MKILLPHGSIVETFNKDSIKGYLANGGVEIIETPAIVEPKKVEQKEAEAPKEEPKKVVKKK